MALCTRGNVRTYLEIDNADTKKDNLIDEMIAPAQSFLEEYCRTKFESESATDYFTGPSKVFCLKRFNVSDVVVYDDWQRVFGASSIISSDDYYVETENGIIYLDYSIGQGIGTVKITYTGGFTTVPEAIRQACVELVGRKVKEAPFGGLQVSSKSMEGGSINFDISAISPQTKIALDLFTRPLIG